MLWIALFCGAAAPIALSGREDAPPLARLLAPNTAVFATGPGLARLCDSAQRPGWFEGVRTSSLFEQARGEIGAGIEQVSDRLGTPLIPLLASVLDRGVVVGVAPRGSSLAVSLAARASSEDELQTAWEDVRAALSESLGMSGTWLDGLQQDWRGFDAWVFGEELALALEGDLLLVANGEGALRDMIDRARDGGPSISARRLPAGELEPGAVAWASFDLAAVEQLELAGLRDLRKLWNDPAVHLLFGSTFARLGTAEHATLGLFADDGQLALRVTGDARPDAVELEWPGDEAAPLAPRTAHDGVCWDLHRDVDGLFRSRVELFDVEVLPGFAEAISGLALFFGGADVQDEILPALGPWATLIVRNARFDEAAIPDVALPAAALVIPLQDAGRVGPRFIGAFQTAIGLVNVESAQEMRPALVMGIELVDGVAMTTANYPEPHPDEGVDMIHNLVPACAVAGERLVIGTHASLVADLIREIGAGELQPGSVGENLNVSGSFLAAALRDNAAALAMTRVLARGGSVREARAFVDEVLQLVDGIAELDLALSDRELEGTDATRQTLTITCSFGNREELR